MQTCKHTHACILTLAHTRAHAKRDQRSRTRTYTNVHYKIYDPWKIYLHKLDRNSCVHIYIQTTRSFCCTLRRSYMDYVCRDQILQQTNRSRDVYHVEEYHYYAHKHFYFGQLLVVIIQQLCFIRFLHYYRRYCLFNLLAVNRD